eukprot:NODE_2717_length_888_cov_365.045618.p1 GENE.NODE_2717_length_888_cov_365.045618~~NODE_2717_length_888_cov_365.045618.p1  ORF type:complete len:171 (+),score=31.39 NODE_2717_length_888_cov_365.045618:3-515(+)
MGVHLRRCIEEDRCDALHQRATAEHHASQLREQIGEANERRTANHLQLIEQASRHDFPRFTEPSQAQIRNCLHERRMRLRSDLATQVAAKAHQRLTEQQCDHEWAQRRNDINGREMKLLREEELAKKQSDRNVLTQSWGHDSRLRALAKSIENHDKAPSQPRSMLAPGLL